MTSINDVFPSKWLKADDLQGQTAAVVIARWANEEVSDNESKPVLYFHNKAKGMVLNKTNAMSIAQGHGDDIDGWVGKSIELFSAMVQFQGQIKPAIRVRPVTAPTVAPAAAQPTPVPIQQGGPGQQAAVAAQAMSTDPADLDDSIPF